MRIEDVVRNIVGILSPEQIKALNIAFERGNFSVRDAVYLEVQLVHKSNDTVFKIHDTVVMRHEKNAIDGSDMYSDCKGLIINL